MTSEKTQPRAMQGYLLSESKHVRQILLPTIFCILLDYGYFFWKTFSRGLSDAYQFTRTNLMDLLMD